MDASQVVAYVRPGEEEQPVPEFDSGTKQSADKTIKVVDNCKSRLLRSSQ